MGVRRVDGIVIMVARRAEEGAPVETEVGNGVVEDAENGVVVSVEGEERRRGVDVAGELSPMGAADGASKAAMPHIGRNAREVERVRALRREYCFSCAVT